jgi:hypothetical protein
LSSLPVTILLIPNVAICRPVSANESIPSCLTDDEEWCAGLNRYYLQVLTPATVPTLPRTTNTNRRTPDQLPEYGAPTSITYADGHLPTSVDWERKYSNVKVLLLQK